MAHNGKGLAQRAMDQQENRKQARLMRVRFAQEQAVVSAPSLQGKAASATPSSSPQPSESSSQRASMLESQQKFRDAQDKINQKAKRKQEKFRKDNLAIRPLEVRRGNRGMDVNKQISRNTVKNRRMGNG